MEKSTPAKDQQETIFDETELLSRGYDKQVRHARNAIFVVAAIQLVFGLFFALSEPEETKWITIGVSIVLASSFAGLGFWANSKPYPAILTALILFALIIVVGIIFDPASAFRGIIFKVFIVVYLVKGLNNARETLHLKQALGKE